MGEWFKSQGFEYEIDNVDRGIRLPNYCYHKKLGTTTSFI